MNRKTMSLMTITVLVGGTIAALLSLTGPSLANSNQAFGQERLCIPPAERGANSTQVIIKSCGESQNALHACRPHP